MKEGKKRGISKKNKIEFCNDLVNAVEYAKRKNVSTTAVYRAVKSGLIHPDDIYMISGHPHWEWSKYQFLVWRDYNSGN